MRRVLLLSGGLDSMVMLAEAVKAKDNIYTLHVTYGSYAKHETTVARQIARMYRSEAGGVIDHFVVHAPLDKIAPVALTDGCGTTNPVAVPETWIVPCRNTVLLSLALALAESKECDAIGIGVHRGDDPFPDQSPAFIESFQAVSDEGTKVRPRIEAPFLSMSKAEVIFHGSRMHVPMERSLSCYQPACMEHCGQCAACIARKKAFADAKVPDETEYATGF